MADRSAGSHNRTSGPALGGNAPPQGADEIPQGLGPSSTTARFLAGDRFGPTGESAGLRGAQQHVSPQFMPHLQWCSLRLARVDFPAETVPAAASIPPVTHETITANTASGGLHRRVRESSGRSAKGPFLSSRWGGRGEDRTIKSRSHDLRHSHGRQGDRACGPGEWQSADGP